MKKRTGTYPLRLPASRAAPKPISKQHAAFCEGTAVNRRNEDRLPMIFPRQSITTGHYLDNPNNGNYDASKSTPLTVTSNGKQANDNSSSNL